jgi:formylglycine-generating enzyme required for sulfatase activity
MADIFVSYKRADRERVARIVALLENEGWNVWWDNRVFGDRRWNALIERELEAARCVVVVWSQSSIGRDQDYWVHLNAHRGRERGILVPVTVEGVAPPSAFQPVQTRDLTHWNGASREGAEDFLKAVKETLGHTPGAAMVLPQPPPVPSGPDADGLKPSLEPGESPETQTAADFAKMRRSAQRLAGTLYAEMVEERIADLEEEERAKTAAQAAARDKAMAEAAAKAEAGRKQAEAERNQAEAARAEIRERIARASGRGELFALWREDPQAAAVRLQELGFVPVLSLKDGKPAGYWLKPGESFRDLDIAPEMVVAPAGEFWMGSKDGECDAYERPRHKVTIAGPFAVGKYPVTFAEWDAALAAGAVEHKPSHEGWGGGRRPVINVNWEEAHAYVRWLSSVARLRYRLLSEAEWEYCCRAGTETPYSSGNTITKKGAQFSEGIYGGAGKTIEVGSFPANAFGLHDMHGNVWEWCQDCWNDHYYDAPGDGTAWTSGNCSRRVLRGGSWNSEPGYLRSACRNNRYPDLRFSYVGFRVARTLNP